MFLCFDPASVTLEVGLLLEISYNIRFLPIHMLWFPTIKVSQIFVDVGLHFGINWPNFDM